MDILELNEPYAPDATAIFQVTLPNGAIMTRAESFAQIDVVQRLPLVGENGEILAVAHGERLA